MTAIMMPAVEQLLARANEPLKLSRYQEIFSHDILQAAEGSDSLLALDANNPLLLKDDLAVQKDQYRKIKHAYLEHDAKRNFVYSITGDDPKSVPDGENEDLEEQNMVRKGELRVLKEEIEGMRSKSVEIARGNTKKHSALASQITETSLLHSQIKEIELELQRIRASHPPGPTRLTTAQAQALVGQQDEEIANTMEKIEVARQEIEDLRGENGRLGKEVIRLAKEREREEERAKEVRDGRDGGEGRVDELCHWLSSSMAFYRTLLGIRSVQAISENTIQLEYDIPDRGVVTLLLEYDQSTRRLADARLLGSEIDVKEFIDLALVSNDAPGLIGDILSRLRR